jgi:hypothetical protein
MALELLILVAIQVALFVAFQLLAPKPEIENARPKGLGEFKFPTATEDRQVPIVWGTVELRAPNVIWYGHLRTRKITDKVKTGLFSSKKITVGFRYFIGMDMALCYGPLAAYRRIRVSTKELWSGNETAASDTGAAIVINRPSILGGELKGGGIRGTLRAFAGRPGQQPSTYLESVLGSGNVPGYVDIAHAVWEQGEIGESESIAPWFFTVQRFPNQLGLSSGRHIVNTSDANPAAVLYEVLVDDVWGLDLDPGSVNTASFQAAGVTLHAEGNGWSSVVDRTEAGTNLVQDLLRQMDAVLYVTAEGEFFLKLARGGYTPSALPLFDDSSVLEVSSFTRAAWGETSNNVEISYIARDKEYEGTSARAQDLANVRIQGGRNVLAQSTYRGVKDAALARAIAARELRALSYPLAKVSLIVSRSGAGLKPGDVIRWSSAAHGVTEMVLRIGNVGLGELDNGRVTLTCFEDVFGLGNATFAATPPSGWTPVSNAPVAATVEKMMDCPFWFILTDQDLQGQAGERAISLVERPNSRQVSIDQFADTGSGSGYFRAGEGDFCPTGTLANAYPINTASVDTASDLLIVGNLTDADLISAASATEIAQFGFGLAVIVGSTPADDEIIGFEEVVDLGGGQIRIDTVHRGLLDTVPKAHSTGARIWFLSDGNAVSTLQAFGATAAVNFRNLTNTTFSQLPLASATVRALTFARRSERPIVAGDLKLGGVPFPAMLPDGDVAATWAHRNRLDPLILDQNAGNSSLGLPSGVEHRLVWKALPSGTTIRTQDTTSTSYTYPRATQISDNGGVAPQALRLEVVARRTSDGLLSRATHVREFEVFTPAAHSIELSIGEFFQDNTTRNHGIGDVWTLAFWIKRTNTNAALANSLFNIRPSTGAINLIEVVRPSGDASALRLRLGDSAGTIFKNLTWTGALPLNTWAHVVFAFDGSEAGDPVRVYLQGMLTSPSTTTTDTTGTMTNTNRIVDANTGLTDIIARHYSYALWNSELPANSVAAIYAGGRAFNLNYDKGNYAQRANLQHWWRLGYASSDANLGLDYALSPPSACDLMANAVAITVADDRVSDAPA